MGIEKEEKAKSVSKYKIMIVYKIIIEEVLKDIVVEILCLFILRSII